MIEMLLEYGSLGIFLVFLVWQYTSMQKRLDALVATFQSQLDAMRSENRNEVEQLRARYDVVVDRYNHELTEIRLQLLQEIEEVNRKTDALLLTQESTSGLLDDMHDRIKVLEKHIGKIQDNLDRTHNTLKEMLQEAKLKELADKAVAARG